MKRRKYCLALLTAFYLVLFTFLQGCGGGRSAGISSVSGTVSDINRNVVIGAEVWVDDHTTESLVSGAYRLDGVPSGWRTIRAQATINGEMWVGSTAAEVLRNEPTMNVNIVLAPAGETTEVGGYVEDDTSERVEGARVLLTTRLVDPPEDTSAYDGPYGSIMAVTDRNGRYLMEDVPVGLSGIISASKVGFRNREYTINTTSAGHVINFTLTPAFTETPNAPLLEAIESYTMPDTVTRGDADAFKAIRAYTSERFRKAIAQQRLTRSTPDGSLIEIDLYWNALDVNDSRDIAGYGIYRTTSLSEDPRAIDFVRDPYANFYGDTGIELTPGTLYYYAVTSVSLLFLDELNRTNPDAESPLSDSDFLSVRPLGQLEALSPSHGASASATPTFRWDSLPRAETYTVYLYGAFPTLPLDPTFDGYSDEELANGTLPIWTSADDPGRDLSATSVEYDGPALTPGHSYYWVVLAEDPTETAFSYSEIRRFTVQ